jgi:hypothetical protein
MGCGWSPRSEVDYSLISAVEVVNGFDADTPMSGIPFWQALLSKGYRLTAIGGSDNHDALRPKANLDALGDITSPDARSAEVLARMRSASGAIGTPTTVVYAAALSQAAIIEGIRRGRVFIDLGGSGTRSLELTATSGSRHASMGESLQAGRGVPVRFDVRAVDLAGGRIDVVVDGRVQPLLRDAQVGTADQSFVFEWRGDARPHWIRVDGRDARGRLALLANPIYVNAQTR